MKNALNLLMVTPRYFPYIGGIETLVYEVGRRLVRQGVNVTLLTAVAHDFPVSLPREDVIEGMHILRVKAWPRESDYTIAPEIYSTIQSGTWDIVHCQGYHTFFPLFAMLAAKQAKIPYVVSFLSGGDTNCFRKAIRGVQRMVLRPLLAEAKRLIGLSRWEAEFFRKQLHLPGEQFAVISCGANHLPELTDCVERKKDSTLIVSVGRLERYKGHQRVIAALPKIQERIPDVQLRVVGLGPYESALRELAKKLGVADRVEIGAVPPGDGKGMASIIAQADLVTLLSEHEGQGIAVLEALALRRPVLVADASALREFAEQGLARAVSLQSTPEEIARVALQQILEPLIPPPSFVLPTWDECAEQLQHVYNACVEGRQECVS
jgi:glycosyltransferase involved in cell wall biosynthesis